MGSQILESLEVTNISGKYGFATEKVTESD